MFSSVTFRNHVYEHLYAFESYILLFISLLFETY